MAQANTTATEPVESDPDCYLSSRQIQRLCSGICERTLRRWRKRESLQFPKPIKINRRYYWQRSEILTWLADHKEAA